MFDKYSIRTKFAVFVALLVGVTGLLISGYVLWQQYRNQLDELHGDAITSSMLFQRVLTDPLRLGDDFLVFELIRAPFNDKSNTKGLGGRSLQHILLLNDAGVVLSSSSPEQLPLNVAHVQQEPEFRPASKLLPALKMEAQPVFVDHDEIGGFYVITPLGENGVKYANLLLDYSALPLRSDFIRYGQKTVLAIVLLTVLIILFGQLLVRHFTRPLLVLRRRMALLAAQHGLKMASTAKINDEVTQLRTTFECFESALNQTEQQRDLSIQREKLAFAGLEHSTQGISIIDLNASIVYVNSAFERNTGYSRGEAIGQNPRFLKSGKTALKIHTMMMAALRQEQPWQGELLNRRKDGSEYVELVTISPVRLDGVNVSHYLVVHEDISERLVAEAKIRHQAHHDALTELPNRVLLEDRLSQSIKIAARNGGQFALMFLDLDHFKQVNDLLGHSIGDQLLKMVARRLVDLLRETDTVCRLGGDEFVLLLSPVSGAAEAQGVAAKIVQTLLEPYQMDNGKVLKTSVSIGIALFPEHGANADLLTRNADIAMYQAKEYGRNHYQLFSSEMHRRLHDRVTLEEELRMALDQQQFLLHYQPQFSAHDGEMRGIEALIRWQHPQRGLLYPGDFIERAEASGQIIEIGAWVINEACRQIRVWLDAGLNVPLVAVNVSFRQFHQHDLETVVSTALQQYRLPGSRLELELTESVMLSNPEKVYSVLRNLREQGLKFSIDDFGTGYSSLLYLKRLDVDMLKIDRSFIIDMETAQGKAMVETIIGIARNLDLHTVAEGVETEAQLTMLQHLGCQNVQGYLLSKPLSVADLTEKLRRENK